MPETSEAVPQAPADLDQRDSLDELDDDIDDDIEDQSDDDSVQQEPITPHVMEDAEHHASFTVRHGLQGVDPGITKRLVQAGMIVVVGAALVTLRRLLRRKPKLCIDNAWAWTTEEQPGPRNRVDLARPLLGYSIAVAEKCE